jgi:hypothetical protein
VTKIAGKANLICFVLLSWITTHNVQAAPVIAQDRFISYWGASIGLGQTFVWPTSSTLGLARVTSRDAITATFKLYNGSHSCDDSGGEIYSQAGANLVPGVYSTIVLTTPQNLVNGNTYTFCFYNEASGGTTVLQYTSNVSYYAGGVFVSDATINPLGTGGDLQFELDIPPTTPVTLQSFDVE